MKTLTIQIKDLGDMQIITPKLDGLSTEEAIVVLNRCMQYLLLDTRYHVGVEEKNIV